MGDTWEDAFGARIKLFAREREEMLGLRGLEALHLLAPMEPAPQVRRYPKGHGSPNRGTGGGAQRAAAREAAEAERRAAFYAAKPTTPEESGTGRLGTQKDEAPHPNGGGE